MSQPMILAFILLLPVLAFFVIMPAVRFNRTTHRIVPLLKSDLRAFLRESVTAVKRENNPVYRDILRINLSAGLCGAGAWEEALRILRPVHVRRLGKMFRAAFYNNRIYALALSGRVDEARQLYRQQEKVLARCRGVLGEAILDTSATLLYLEGDYHGCITFFADSFSGQTEKSAESCLFFGAARWKTGDRQEAARLWQQALQKAQAPWFARMMAELAGDDEPGIRLDHERLAAEEKELEQFLAGLMPGEITENGGMAMNSSTKTYLAFFTLLFLATLVFFAVVLNDGESGAYDSAYWLLDAAVENGLFNTPARYDDPLLTDFRTIVISEKINEKISKEVAGKLLYLNGLDPEAPIDLMIKSHGGWQGDAYLIIDTMQMISAPVNTWSAGDTFSAGAMILVAGTGTRYALPNALIMVHVVEEDGEDEPNYANSSRKRFEEFWRRHSRLPDEYYPMNYMDEFYFTAEEALQMGIVDEIHNRPERY
jgi:ATP-dependent Clp protease, protease subunit